MSPAEADAAARKLMEELERLEVCRLLVAEHGADFRHVDDRTLVSWLAAGLRAGRIDHPAARRRPAPRRARLGRGDSGTSPTLLSNMRHVPGYVRQDIGGTREAAAIVERLLSEDQSRDLLLSFVDDDHRAASSGGGNAPRGVVAECVARLGSGELNLFRPAAGQALPAPTVSPDFSRPRPRPSTGLDRSASTSAHWIEIVLVDDDGQPVGGEPYELTLPDGERRKGVLGDDGSARFAGLSQTGACALTFPRIDAREWRKI